MDEASERRYRPVDAARPAPQGRAPNDTRAKDSFLSSPCPEAGACTHGHLPFPQGQDPFFKRELEQLSGLVADMRGTIRNGVPRRLLAA